MSEQPAIHASAETIFERAVMNFLRERCGAAVDAKALELVSNAEAVIKAFSGLEELQKQFTEKVREELAILAKRRAGEIAAALKITAEVKLTVVG